MNDSAAKWLLSMAVLTVLVAGYWYFRTGRVDPEPESTPGTAAPVAEEPSSPRYPLPERPAESTDQRELVPLPPLDDSDSYFELALISLYGDLIEQLLVDEALIEKLVATVDNLPRQRLAEQIRPVSAAPGAFAAIPGEEDDVFVLGPENFHRYDSLVDRVASADMELAVDTYRRFYPLLQEAYVNLGYPDKHFNDRVVEVIDHLLETPAPAEPLPLVRPHVFFQFADPELEALSSGQKLMLRIGSDNAAKVQRVLAAFRSRIVDAG